VEQDVPGYAWLIAQGEYTQALQAILARNPLPGVTGYVCTRLCQTRCTRNDYEESVAIRALKRIAEERGRAGYAAGKKPATGRKAAVIGSGPSGLAAAAFLALNGLQVVVFEARDVPGGMLRLVPPFRLPQEVIDRDIGRIAALGVEIRLNAAVAGPPEALLEQGFAAVYLASGFQRDAPLRVPGVDGDGVVPALQLLERCRRGARPDLGAKAVVIGGGDTAMDAARTAQRLTGAPVTILYRRSRRELPADEEELTAALEEGNVLQELAAPVEIVRRNGKVAGVRCVRTALGGPGPDGRRKPVEIPGSDFVISCDTVIVAVGQLPELAFLDGSRVMRHERGGVAVDPATCAAGPDGVYAGGDVVVEPGDIITACADGRKAAEAICAHLNVQSTPLAFGSVALSDQDIIRVKTVRARRIAQAKPAVMGPAARLGFGLVESTFTEEQARLEGLRCVQCSTFCDKCVEVCPNRANYTFRIGPVAWELPVIEAGEHGLRVARTEAFRIVQGRQILHVDDFCNECDNCQTFCVHRGRPYADKPRLFLTAEGFDAEDDNAFRIDGSVIWRREHGQECSLTVGDESLTYEDAALRIDLTRDWRVKMLTAVGPVEGPQSLKPAAEMAVLYDGIASSLPFLLID
jgi:putative selenate reductase